MPNIGELSLYDVVGTPGVAADVSHMDTKPKVWFSCTWHLLRPGCAQIVQACVLMTVHDCHR